MQNKHKGGTREEEKELVFKIIVLNTRFANLTGKKAERNRMYLCNSGLHVFQKILLLQECYINLVN